MKKIVILSYFIAFVFVVLFPRSFIFAAEETENYETSLAVDNVKLFGETERLVLIGGHHQIKRKHRGFEASSRVQARSEAETDRLRIDFGDFDAADLR